MEVLLKKVKASPAMFGRFIKKIVAASLLVLLLPLITAHAEERWFLDAGISDVNSGLAIYGGVESDWDWSYDLAGGVIKGAWQLGFSAAYWKDARILRQFYSAGKGVMYSGGITPLLRWEMAIPLTIEAGLGVHLVGHRPSNQLATIVEFGSLAGLYYRYSPDLSIGYRMIHFSNADIKQPNGGVNFHLLHVGFSF